MSAATEVRPFWFPQRQLNAEEVSEDFYRITGPNIADSYIGVRRLGNGNYQGYFRRNENDDNEAVTGIEFSNPYNAWEGTFELYRQKMIF